MTTEVENKKKGHNYQVPGAHVRALGLGSTNTTSGQDRSQFATRRLEKSLRKNRPKLKVFEI